MPHSSFPRNGLIHFSFNLLHSVGQALDSLTLTSGTRRNCVKSLYKTCAHHSLYPRSLQIAACYDPADVPYSHGGYADVWKGEYRGVEVGVKVLRTYVTSDLKKITHVSRW